MNDQLSKALTVAESRLNGVSSETPGEGLSGAHAAPNLVDARRLYTPDNYGALNFAAVGFGAQQQ